ncbi:hypothetical protein ACWC3Y_11185 [Streptomyces sp. NPDC001296]
MSRPVKRPLVNHAAAAARLRARPGTWLVVGEYRSSLTADHMAYLVRTAWTKRGTRSPYAPAGSFEAVTRLTEAGACLVARYIGTNTPEGPPLMSTPTPPDHRAVRPMTDAERVLGQIERGEVLAGPEAARRIAARHQKAYGNAVWGPDNDTAWADALTALQMGGAE